MLKLSKTGQGFGQNKNYVKIFYLKPESVFVEYADKAAELWYQNEEKRLKEEAERKEKEN